MVPGACGSFLSRKLSMWKVGVEGGKLVVLRHERIWISAAVQSPASYYCCGSGPLLYDVYLCFYSH